MLRLLKYIASGAVGIGAIVAGVVTSERTATAYDVRTVYTGCASSSTVQGAGARAEGNSIIVLLPISTPDPCYQVNGLVSRPAVPL